MRNSTKWSQEMRRFIYITLLVNFGEYNTWTNKTVPGNGFSILEYEQKLQEIANHLNKYYLPKGKTPITMMAVKNQINWTICNQYEIKSREQHYNYILNMAAALEVGFMKSSDLSNNVFKK